MLTPPWPDGYNPRMRVLGLCALLAALLLAVAACSIIQASQTEKRVLKALAADQRTAAYQFDVSCDEQGTVVITGTLYRPEEEAIVTQIARVVPGVKQVVNHCKLEEPGSTLFLDDTITAPYLP